MPVRQLIVRPGAEVATKHHRTRARFARALVSNLVEAFKRRGVAASIEHRHRRMFIETQELARATDIAAHVFGVGTLSPVLATAEASLSEIVKTGAAVFSPLVHHRRYAVRVRRHGHYSFGSRDVAVELGRALNAQAQVDLEHPDVTAYVELVAETAFLYTDRLKGAGGLPNGVQGHALALLSGGFDSAVAAWRVMRRGAHVDFVFFNLGGRAHERQVLQIAKVLTELWAYGRPPRLHVVSFQAPVMMLKQSVKAQYWQVVLKRMMYRAAELIAVELEAEALITGESLGQVSSQTMANLTAIDGRLEVPVLRPLIAQDKTEIVQEARRIGTALLSERVMEQCGLASVNPVIATNRSKLDRQEALIDYGVVRQAVTERQVFDLPQLEAKDLRAPYLFTRDVPPGAQLVDCQVPPLDGGWRAPGALRLNPEQLLRSIKGWDRSQTYVLYCKFGAQTPVLAEALQQIGYEAYAYEGGVTALRRALEGESACPIP